MSEIRIAALHTVVTRQHTRPPGNQAGPAVGLRPDRRCAAPPSLLMLALVQVLTALLAPAAHGLPSVPVQQYTADDGLAGSVVRGIERTSDGVMWFGCWGRGVSSYDGLAWRSYGTEDGLPSLDVRAVRIDANGRLWAGTSDGIACLTGTLWNAMRTGTAKIEPMSVYSILPFPDGSLWFGLGSGQILSFVPATLGDRHDPPAGEWSIVLDRDQSGGVAAIEALHLLPDASVVVGTDTRGILRWRAGDWFQEPGDADALGVDDIAETASGVLYAGGRKRAARRFAGGSIFERVRILEQRRPRAPRTLAG
jgi:hypothetical protein